VKRGWIGGGAKVKQTKMLSHGRENCGTEKGDTNGDALFTVTTSLDTMSLDLEHSHII
jgi:hypothetical protein